MIVLAGPVGLHPGTDEDSEWIGRMARQGQEPGKQEAAEAE
jgi:hypothetical protein